MKHEAVAEFYNQIQDKFGKDYESKRWFKSKITESHYRMTKDAITQGLHTVSSVAQCLELGPGAGTWTKLLKEKYPTAEYTLVDISDAMLSIAKENLKMHEGLTFISHDFSTYEPTHTIDLFFSSRALEYILDKEKALEKIATILTKGGKGILITKNPRYWADKLLGREIPPLHRNQIQADKLVALLEQKGFKIRTLRPATVTVPFFKSARLNDLAYRVLKFGWIPFIHPFFAESYIVSFEKL